MWLHMHIYMLSLSSTHPLTSYYNQWIFLPHSTYVYIHHLPFPAPPLPCTAPAPHPPPVMIEPHPMAKQRRTEQPSDQLSEPLLWLVLHMEPFCMSWHETVLLYNTIAIELQF